jgi:predicted phosphodiesterase
MPKPKEPAIALLDSPIKPLKLPAPSVAKPRKSGKETTALLFGDTHVPHHDQRALNVVFAIAKETQPDVIVCMGDLLDCYSLSRWDKNPERKESVQDEIDLARVILAHLRVIAPHSRIIYLEGNHEDRLRRTLWNLEGAASVLAQLTNVKAALTWPALLGLDQLGIEFVPYNQQSKHRFLPKFLVTHGTVVRSKSSQSAAGEHAKYGISGASGHTHRLGVYYERDQNGDHVWVECGCTCDTDPEYAVAPNWQQGCVFASFDNTTGAAALEPVYIKDGTAQFRGTFYRG